MVVSHALCAGLAIENSKCERKFGCTQERQRGVLQAFPQKLRTSFVNVFQSFPGGGDRCR